MNALRSSPFSSFFPASALQVLIFFLLRLLCGRRGFFVSGKYTACGKRQGNEGNHEFHQELLDLVGIRPMIINRI